MDAEEAKTHAVAGSVLGRKIGVAEDGIGVADIADGAEISQGKAVEPLGFVAANVADGAEFEAPVTQTESATAPVVDGLNAAVLQRAMDKIVAAGRGQIEADLIGFSDLQEGLQLLALDG